MSEYEIKEGFLSAGHSYTITSKTNAPTKFTIQNELFNLGKKLILLEDNKERYTVKHDLTSLMSTWTIKETSSGKEVGTIENKLKFVGSTMVASGTFGNYKIKGAFGKHSFSIKKDGVKVARIEKKSFHVRDTYGLTVYGDADRALMVLFTVIVDEIQQH